MKYDFHTALELSVLASNIKKEICEILDDFFILKK